MTARKSYTRYFAYAGLVVLPAGAWLMAREQPAWFLMWTLAGALFLALKLLTLTADDTGQRPTGRILAYVMLWPGMDARAFLDDRGGRQPVTGWGELGFAGLKLAGGLAAAAWAANHAGSGHPLLVGWVGMVGIIFMLHFGGLHGVSWGWRRLGVNAPPIMRAPILADSLADFWGGRWNAAFADVARRFVFRPMVRVLGTRGAGVLVFFVSGVVHEVAISVPACGGWGGPTLYFLIQGAGVALEKSALGKRLGLSGGFRGWAWMALCTITPVPLLFHPPFVHHVIVPFFQTLQTLLP